MPRPRKLNVSKIRATLQHKSDAANKEAKSRKKHYEKVREALEEDEAIPEAMEDLFPSLEYIDEDQQLNIDNMIDAIIVPTGFKNNFMRPFLPEEGELLLSLQNYFKNSITILEPIFKNGIVMLERECMKVSHLISEIKTPRSTESLQELLYRCVNIRAPDPTMANPLLNTLETVIRGTLAVVLYREKVPSDLALVEEVSLKWILTKYAGTTGLEALDALKTCFVSVQSKLQRGLVQINNMKGVVTNLSENIPRTFRISIND